MVDGFLVSFLTMTIRFSTEISTTSTHRAEPARTPLSTITPQLMVPAHVHSGVNILTLPSGHATNPSQESLGAHRRVTGNTIPAKLANLIVYVLPTTRSHQRFYAEKETR